MRLAYPFTAIVGQERAKLALLLSVVDPDLGGVLLVGPKGSGKSTLVRALEDVLPEVEYVEGCPYHCDPRDLRHLCPGCRERLEREGHLPTARRRMSLVELPIGASEDGLLGTIDTEAALREGVKRIKPGLLARANQNILYIDDVNFLPDHLVDCILDPAASGWSIVEREGVSLLHPARFTLIASMNPEEGELRPQILDRFALRVELELIEKPELRAEIARRNVEFEENPEGFYKRYADEQRRLRERLERARSLLPKVEVSRHIMEGVAEACSRLGVEGLRSDLAVIRAARALAALEGRTEVEEDDILRVFDLATAHRIREEPKRRIAAGVIREVLLGGAPGGVIEKPVRLKPSLEVSPSRVSARRIKKMRRRRLPLSWLLHALAVAGLLIALSFVLSMFTLFVRALILNQPITEAVRMMTPKLIFLHLVLVSALFLLFSLLFSRRVVQPVVYLYTYLGSELRRRIVLQQSHPPERYEAEKPMEDSTIINIPVIASLRRLYRVLVGKGAKLMEAGGRRRVYRFEMVRRGRRLKGGVGRRSKLRARSRRGRYVSYEFPKEKPWDIALGPTIRAAAPHQPYRERCGLALRVEPEDVRVKVREMRAPLTIVLLLDMSESMIPSLPNVRNAILSMRDIVLRRRDRLALIVFKGEGAATLQTPTTNIELVVRKLRDIGASDLTPLASGMFEAWRVLRNERLKNKEAIPILVIISDGIANVPLDSPLSPHTRKRYVNHAQADVIDVAHLLRREGIRTLVINPAHVEHDEISERYKRGIEERTGKIWLEPKELLMEIPRITGGYYYGITERGELEEALLMEAFTILR